jgi:hypothetical protein
MPSPGSAGRWRAERVSGGAGGWCLAWGGVPVSCAACPESLVLGCSRSVDRERKVPVVTEFETIGLEPVESLTITTLVDNVTDILLLDEGPAIRAASAWRTGPVSACASWACRWSGACAGEGGSG